MRSVDISKLKRYESGKYKGKIDWSSNIGEKVKFIYNEVNGEIEIVDYVKEIPMGTITVRYEDNTQQMKTTALTKCGIGNLIKYHNYDYIYNIGDILNTIHNSNLLILKQIEIFHTNYYERGYTVKCLDCGHIFDTMEVHISSCPKCSDRVSYPEKFVINMFNQLNINIELQKTFEWSGLKRYDIYIPIYDMIIEVNGAIHYIPTAFASDSKIKKCSDVDKYNELKLRQNNDKSKKDLAIRNGILNYVIINAKESNLTYIKSSILKNKRLRHYFNFQSINWDDCHEFSIKSIVKQVSNMFNDKYSKDEISNILEIPVSSVVTYLREGDKLGYCKYDKKINYVNGHNIEKAKLYYKPVICINTGEIFESQAAATKAYNIYKSGINDCCKGRIPSAGKHPETKEPLKWKYYISE